MKRMLLVVAVLGCEAGLQIRPPIPVANVTVAVPVGGPPPGETVATPPEGGQAQVAAAGSSCSGDSQCLAPDDVLICPRAKWDCRVSHTMVQPTEQNLTGTFLQVQDGKQVQTDRWYNTRPLGQGEQLRLGQPVLYSTDHVDNRVYMGATTHDGQLKARWQFGAVTDLSELQRGIVHIEDSMAHVSNVRVITSGGSQTPPP